MSARITGLLTLVFLTSTFPSWGDAAESAATDLQEVVVTATHRDTPLLETPMSMTVIGADTLAALDATDMSDVVRVVPGLSALDSGPGQKRYALRGLQAAGEPEVALYYDEIPIRGLPGNSLDSGDDQPDFGLWDVDRIEVLRGPQGTLYGNGSLGGAIRILSRQPDLVDYQGAVRAEAATTSGGSPSWQWNGMANIPVVPDQFAVRLTAYYRNEGGWIDEVAQPGIVLPQLTGRNLNWNETWGTRGSFSVRLADNWSILGIAYFQSLKTGDANETYPGAALPGDRYVAEAFIRTPWNDLSHMFNLISTTELTGADLVVTGSYQQRSAQLNLASTRTNLSLFGCTIYTWDQTCFGPRIVPADSMANETVSAYSAEARLVSKSKGPWQWTLGSFYQPTTTTRQGHVATTDAEGLIVDDPATGIPEGQIFARNNRDQFDQYAAFGEAGYTIAQKIDLDVGLRWFHSYRSDQQTVVQAFLPGQPVGAEPFQEFSQSALFKKFEISYHAIANSVIYAEAAQGFRAGGPNYPGGFTTSAPPYRADSVWDYELGWKRAFAASDLAISAAVFRMNWSNVQQLVPTSLFSYIMNAGSARSDGFETELTATPLRSLQLSASASFNNAHLIGPQPLSSSPQAQLAEGDALGGVPKWTASASAAYTRPIGGALAVETRLFYTYQSGRNSVTALDSPAFFEIRGGGLTNTAVSLKHGERWDLGLRVDNLFNEYVPLTGKALDGNLVHTLTAAQPRTVRLTFSATIG